MRRRKNSRKAFTESTFPRKKGTIAAMARAIVTGRAITTGTAIVVTEEVTTWTANAATVMAIATTRNKS